MIQTSEGTGMVPRFARWLAERDETGAASAAFPSLPPDTISFSGGAPSPDLFPVDALEHAFSRALREDGAKALQYGPAEGIPILREIVAARLANRGIHVGPDEILITSGSLQGLHLAGSALLDDGDLVVTESPTFMGALGAWANHRPRYACVPVDEDGMVVDALEDVVRDEAARPRFVYALPTFQNPTGVSLSVERRRRLVEVANAYDLVILEDDPYGEIWFDEAARHLPPLRSLPGAEDRVLYLGSFSKILSPGIRLGFVVAKPALMRGLVEAKQGIDMHTNGLVQYGVAHLFRASDFDAEAHIAGLRQAYQAQRDAMLDTLETEFPAGTSWTRPAGGFFLWGSLGEEHDAAALLPIARAEGVSFIPGSRFYPTGGPRDTLRLSYSNVAPDRVAEGVRRLVRALESHSR